MAGSQVTIPISAIEKQRTGFQAISLTNFDNDNEPQIAAGSVVEIGGSSALFQFTTLESITGWAGIGNNNSVFIKLVVSGTSVTAEFTTAAPTWSTSKQGWYVGLDRYIGGLYKDAAGDYTAKYLLDPTGRPIRKENIDTDAVVTAKIKDANVTEPKLASSAVSQTKLKTSQGEVSVYGTDPASRTLPGGEYGFYPRIKFNPGEGGQYGRWSIGNLLNWAGTSYTTLIQIDPYGIASTGYANQRYITASGPVKWIFLLRDKKTKQVIGTYIAEDHPCYGNGGDPDLTPHPFPDFSSKTQEIVVLNPTDEEWQEIIDHCLTEDRMFDPSKTMWESFCSLFKIDEKSKANYPDIEITIGLNIDQQVVKRRIRKPDMVTVKKIKR